MPSHSKDTRGPAYRSLGNLRAWRVFPKALEEGQPPIFYRRLGAGKHALEWNSHLLHPDTGMTCVLGTCCLQRQCPVWDLISPSWVTMGGNQRRGCGGRHSAFICICHFYLPQGHQTAGLLKHGLFAKVWCWLLWTGLAKSCFSPNGEMGLWAGVGKTSAEPDNRYQGLPQLCLYLPNGKQSPWENSGELNTLVKH